MTKFFLDTEFIESGPQHPLHLISIGLVCENGEEYYAESNEFPSHLANPWVREHVLPRLTWKDAKPSRIICQEVYTFVTRCCDVPAKPIFIGYFADYDWVVFCQLFGTMMDLPKGWPMFCYDLKQRCDDLGNPRLPEQGKDEHHSLCDARWNRTAWQFLNDLQKAR